MLNFQTEKQDLLDLLDKNVALKGLNHENTQ